VYEYLEYLYSALFAHKECEHRPEFDTWVIEPFHINAVHLYAYFNQTGLLGTAVASHSPFFKSRTGHTPLAIALEKRFMDCVNAIYKSSKYRLENGDRWSFEYFGDSLISLHYSGYENLHRIYELAMVKCEDPSLPKFCFEDVSLPYSVTSESPITDVSDYGPDFFNTEGNAIVFAQSAFRISMNMGSQESTDYLESLIKCPNESIYGTKVVQMILRQKWAKVQLFLILQALFYVMYLVLLALYSSVYFQDRVFLLWPFLVSFALFSYEILQMYYDGMEYLEDPWNYVDLVRSILLFVYAVSEWFGLGLWDDEVLILLMMFSWLRGISYFRILEKTRYLIKLIMAATIDISAFFIILFYSTIAFSLIYQAHIHDDRSFLDYFLDAFKLNLGELNTDASSTFLGWILFIIVSIINPVIMLNLLISIMSDTYGRVKEKRVVADARQLAEMILEVESIMGWRRGLNEMFYLKMFCLESELSSADESIEGKLREMKIWALGMMEAVTSGTSEMVSAINDAASSVINAL
jgi:hypothetical protein